MLIAYEDSILFDMLDWVKCKIGKHKEYIYFGGLKVKKYYCLLCGKPRKHPELKVVDGNRKNNKFRF